MSNKILKFEYNVRSSNLLLYNIISSDIVIVSSAKYYIYLHGSVQALNQCKSDETDE